MSDNMGVEQVLAQMRAMRIRAQDTPTVTPAATDQADFGAMLKSSVDQVNATQHQAKEMATRFELGESDASLAEVMVALQKSSLSFQAMVQARNKLVEAYKDVMNMPV